MIFTTECPSCESTFPIDSAKVPEEGVYARCSECDEVFLVVTPAPTGDASAGGQDVAEEVAAAEVAVEVEPEFALEVEVELEPEIATESSTVPGIVSEVDSAEEAAVEDEPPAVEAATDDPSPEGLSELVEQPAVADHVATEAGVRSAPAFGKRDPNERAARLARVLVSDMIAYHPDRHRRSLAEGTLSQEFDDEIQKSWSEYVDQVGKDLAETTPYFRDALNQVLAQGAEVF